MLTWPVELFKSLGGAEVALMSPVSQGTWNLADAQLVNVDLGYVHDDFLLIPDEAKTQYNFDNKYL